MANFSSTYPATKPVFMADFASGGRIDPRATFSRSDTPPTYAAASAVHYWSNQKHLSSENLLLDSKTGTANWTEAASGSAATPTITANHAASPDGTASQATRVQLNLNGATDTSSNSRYNQSISLPSGDSVTFSVWLKSTDGASSYAIQVYQADGNAAAATVTGSWQKFTTTATAASSAAFGIRVRGGQSPTNADTADVLMWGANVSTTGQTVLSETTTQISRSYAPTLKSVATAGAARFEYDPTDGQSAGTSLGCLIESQSTNLATYSSDITQSFYTGFRSTQESNVAVGPDGTLTADLLREDSTSGNSHGVYFEYASGGTTPQTISVYAKAAGRNHLSFRFDTTNGVFGSDFVWFNLSTGAVGTTDSDITASIESCGNGWYRCIATRTALASANGRIVLYLADADNSTSYNGNSYSGVLLWGIQAEANSSFASSLVSTSGAAATRAADSLSVVDSSLFDNGGGALFVEASSSDKSAAYSGIASINDGSSNNRVEVYNYYTYVRADVGADGATQSSQYGGSFSSDVSYKACLTYDTNNVSLYANGSEIGATDTAATMPSVDRITLGNTNSGTNYLNGHLKRVAVYSEPISETAAAALTS